MFLGVSFFLLSIFDIKIAGIAKRAEDAGLSMLRADRKANLSNENIFLVY